MLGGLLSMGPTPSSLYEIILSEFYRLESLINIGLGMGMIPITFKSFIVQNTRILGYRNCLCFMISLTSGTKV